MQAAESGSDDISGDSGTEATANDGWCGLSCQPTDKDGAGGSFSRGGILGKAPELIGEEYVSQYVGPGPWWYCKPNADMPPRLAKAGVASAEVRPITLPQLALEAVKSKGDKAMLKVERPCPPLDEDGQAAPALPEEEWTSWNYSEWLRDVRLAAGGFIHMGFQPYDTVNVWGFNSPEWVMSAFAAMFAGGKVAGLYPTDTPGNAAFKIVQSGGTIAVVEDRDKVGRIVSSLSERGDARRLSGIVAWGFTPAQGETVSVRGLPPVPLLSWKALLASGHTSIAEVDRRVRCTSPGTCAVVIYTSGTTGDPKGVMLAHDNMNFNTASILREGDKASGLFAEGEALRMLSYLPLSHVAGMMLDIVCPVYVAARTRSWVTHFFARPYDLKAGTMKDRLGVAKPTIFLGVPLVWEKVADRLRSIGASKPAPVKKIADWAKGLGLEYSKNCQMGGDGSYPIGYSLANKLILSKIKEALGLDRCKMGLTGAAPIRADTLEYFGSLSLGINEMYGMSESSGVTTISTETAHFWGSCGWQLPGTQVKAFKVDERNFNMKVECPRAPDLDAVHDDRYQGELCFRGRHIMMGYLCNPDMGMAHVKEIEKKNAETIDSEGWLHSGDKGMITKAGLVKITGRYKEIIIGLGGENIAPVPIEDCVKKHCDGIADVMMVGDQRKYNVALVTLKAKEDSDNLIDAALRVNPGVTTIKAAMDDPMWISTIQKAIEATNKNPLACPNPTFKIQKFSILPVIFTEEAGHMTPTKKLKRKAVEKEFAAIIDEMYQKDGVYIRFKS